MSCIDGMQRKRIFVQMMRPKGHTPAPVPTPTDPKDVLRCGEPGVLRALLAQAFPGGVAPSDAALRALFTDRKTLRKPLPGSVCSPLHVACTGGHAGCVAVLLDFGADPTVRHDGLTPAACCTRSLEDRTACLALLLDRGFRPATEPRTASDAYLVDPGWSEAAELVWHAAGAGNVPCLELLAARGVGPFFDGAPEVVPSALAKACTKRRTAAVEWLLERGAPADRKALEAACSGYREAGQAACVRALLARGPDLSGWGHTLFKEACNSATKDDREWVPDPSMFGLLLKHGARPLDVIERVMVLHTVLRDAGRVPAEQMGDWDDLILTVLASGRVPRLLPSSRGETLMAVALRTGNVFAVRALCAFVDRAALGVAVAKEAGDLPPCTPLLLAVSAVDPSPTVRALCVEELIENGALASAASVEELTPLAAVLGDKPSRARDSGVAALLLARWPAHALLPATHAAETRAVIPAALAHAKRRAEVLSIGGGGGDSGSSGGGLLQALAGKFFERVSSGAEQQGSAGAADASFARLRFVEGGGLKRAWVSMRETHRFPVERVAAARAALRVAEAASAEAASRTLALLGWLSPAPEDRSNANGVSRPRDAPEVKRYIAAHAVRRWHEIGEAKQRAERELRAAEVALEAAAVDAEAAVERLAARQHAHDSGAFVEEEEEALT